MDGKVQWLETSELLTQTVKPDDEGFVWYQNRFNVWGADLL